MNKKIPMRQCVGCQEMKSKKELLRIIKTAENEILFRYNRKEKWQRSISVSQWRVFSEGC